MPVTPFQRLRHRLTHIVAGVLALVAVAAVVEAQDAASSGAPLYRVEIIVFRNLSPGARPEDPGRPPLPPSQVDADRLDPETEIVDPPSPGSTAAGGPLHFKLTDAFAMDEALARLRRSSAYRPLVHEGWIQPGLDENLSRPVSLSVLSQLRRLGQEESFRST